VAKAFPADVDTSRRAVVIHRVAALRTVSPNLRGQEINIYQVVRPPAVRKRLLGLPIHEATVRHWADGITADDELVGRPLAFKLRLHRDGSAGIAQKLENHLDLRTIARTVDAYLAYLADFWSTYSLRSPVELVVGISDVSKVIRATTLIGASQGGVVHPPDVTVTKVSISEEVLPWNSRAPMFDTGSSDGSSND